MLAATLLTLAAAAPASAAARPADTVWKNGRIFTADARGTVRQAVAVRDGRIAYVGTDRGVRRYVGRRTHVTDLHGRMVTPGLVDAHMHPLGGGQALLKCSLDYLPLTKEQIRSRIAACLRDTADEGPKAWLEVTAWYQEAMLPAGTKLTAADLDDLSPTRPITVQSSFFHSTVANSTAMRIAGITAATKDPAGGSIDRDAQGAPTGLFNDEAQGLVTGKIPAPTAADDRKAAEAALKAMREQGVTSFLDAAASPDSMAAFRSLRRQGKLTARAHFAPVISADQAKDPAKAVAGLQATRRRFDEGPVGVRPAITVRNAKVFMDGVQQFPAFTAGLLDPYLVNTGTPDHPHFTPGPSRGPIYVQPGALARLLTAIGAAGFDPHVHSIGDRAVRVTLDAVAAMRKATKRRDVRPAMAHAEIVDPADYRRFAQLGVLPVMSYQWAKPGPDSVDAQKDYLGFERWNRVEPEDSLRRAGARITYGSDWPVDPLNEWFALQVGVTRENPAGGKYAGRFNGQKPLPRAYALRSITASGSYALHQDATGVIAPGKLADLIVLDRDVLRTKARRIGATKVLTTMVGGRTVYRARAGR
nr:amidohydrolase [Patulibacter sp. SYSU D01012]